MSKLCSRCQTKLVDGKCISPPSQCMPRNAYKKQPKKVREEAIITQKEARALRDPERSWKKNHLVFGSMAK